MKRIISLITCCVCFAYILMAIYNLSPSYFQQFYIGKVIGKIKYRIGMGILFDRPKSLISKSVSYRFYQNGKWQQNQLLLEPLFDDYKAHGNFAALKHCRLDSQLASRVHSFGKRKGIATMKESKIYAEFIDHLIYRHNKNIKPDSIEVFYYTKNYKTDSLHLSLTVKCKP